MAAIRRRIRYFRPALLATIVLVLVAGLYFYQKGGPEQGPAPAPAPEVKKPIVVANRDIPARTLITPDAVTVGEATEAESFPFFSNPSDVVYRMARRFIRAGEKIGPNDVWEPLTEATLLSLIPPGKVGYVLTIPRRQPFVWVKPGDYVRLYGVFAGVRAIPLVDRVQVLAVDGAVVGREGQTPPGQPPAQRGEQAQTSGGTSARPDMITFFIAVTPKELQSLALATESGASLHYALLPPAEAMLPLAAEGWQSVKLSEITGWRELEQSVARRHDVQVQPGPRPPLPSPPSPRPAISPSLPPLPLPSRVTPAPPKPPQPGPSQQHRRIITAVLGDQRQILSVPATP